VGVVGRGKGWEGEKSLCNFLNQWTNCGGTRNPYLGEVVRQLPAKKYVQNNFCQNEDFLKQNSKKVSKNHWH